MALIQFSAKANNKKADILDLIKSCLVSQPGEAPPRRLHTFSVILFLKVHLNGGGIRGESGGAQIASQQWVERRAKRCVRSSPVCLQVLWKVFTCIFQLVLIQNNIEHLLRWKGQRGKCRYGCYRITSGWLINAWFLKSASNVYSQKDIVPVFLLPQVAHSDVCFEISLLIWSTAGGPVGSRKKYKNVSLIKDLQKLWVTKIHLLNVCVDFFGQHKWLMKLKLG